MEPADSYSADRTQFVPYHRGPNVFPNSVIFSKLLRHAHRRRLAIRDTLMGIEKTYGELLSDVLNLRRVIETSLDATTRQRLARGDEVFVGVLAAGGYEFSVGILAALALGAAVVPMTVGLPVEEASYFVTKSRQVLIVTSAASADLGKEIADYVNDKNPNQKVQTTDILPKATPYPSIPVPSMLISSDRYFDDNAAGLVIFTSGTTGRPKGAVMRRGYIHNSASSVAELFDITAKDVALHVLPVHHATGLCINFFPFLLEGALIEFRCSSFDPAWMWDRWLKGGISFFSGVPTIYMRMMRYFENNLARLPQKAVYIEGAKRIRVMACGSSAFPRPMQNFWTNIRGGIIILTRYGGTEFGGVFQVPLDVTGIPEGSVGPAAPGVDVKLSEGNSGEVLVKSAGMFSKYLYDNEATLAAHDKDGYFRTGDIARREGDFYWIDGRASLDIIKSGGYKISALDIERELLGLPYISEAMVVGVDDIEFGQRVAAAVALREDQNTYSTREGEQGRRLLLDDVRRDLRDRLTGYKLPTVLRVLEGELPKGQTGKVLKKILGPQLFPPNAWHSVPGIQFWTKANANAGSKL